jgi:tripartite-type tricarboxylate transporter receptor subunit TctC
MARAAALILALGLPAAAALAQPASDYPSRPITVVVPYPAGGGVDVVTRVVADKLRTQLGQPVVVENRPGATGGIGATAVFRAEPNGYTLLSVPNAPIVLNPFIQKGLSYDAAALVPVVHLVSAPLVIAVRRDFPADTIQQFIAHARANPGKLNYASQGIGGGAHLATLVLQNATGIDMMHIPFPGAAPALNAIASGQVDLFVDNIGTALPLHRSGHLKILALGSSRRAPELPDIPTLAEAGLGDLDLTTWFGMFAPPHTPPAVVEKINKAIDEILAIPEVRARVDALTLQPVGGSAKAFGDFVAADRARWEKIIRGAKLEAQ